MKFFIGTPWRRFGSGFDYIQVPVKLMCDEEVTDEIIKDVEECGNGMSIYLETDGEIPRMSASATKHLLKDDQLCLKIKFASNIVIDIGVEIKPTGLPPKIWTLC